MNARVFPKISPTWCHRLMDRMKLIASDFNKIHSRDYLSNLKHIKTEIQTHRQVMANMTEDSVRKVKLSDIAEFKRHQLEYRAWATSYASQRINAEKECDFALVFDTANYYLSDRITEIANRFGVEAKTFTYFTKASKLLTMSGVALDTRGLCKDRFEASRFNQLISALEEMHEELFPTAPFGFRPVYWDEELFTEIQAFNKEINQ